MSLSDEGSTESEAKPVIPEAPAKKCDCRWCRLHYRITQVKSSDCAKEKNDLIEHLANELIMTSEDENYHRAILDGSWPSSVELLTRALEYAKVFQRREEEKENAKL